MEIVYLVILGLYGAVLGSFVCCQARRAIEKEEKGRKLGKRSVCLRCGERLRWYDNIPIVSWVMLGGKCRKCEQKIGAAEIIAEVGGAVGFLVVGGMWEARVMTGGAMEWAGLAMNLIFVCVLGYLAIYDGLAGEMPVVGLTILNACAIIGVILREWRLFSGVSSGEGASFLAGGWGGEQFWMAIGGALGAGAIFGGLYYVLYKVSREQWVGGGDWLVGTAVGIMIGTPMGAVVGIFLANALASVVMIGVVKKKVGMKIYLGPWFFAGYIATVGVMMALPGVF